MDTDFWLQRWQDNNIAFHRSEANPLLVSHFKALGLVEGSRVFVPLCGKTKDIAWLLANGYRVAGAELSEMAIEQLFMELGVEPKILEVDAVKHYSATDIDIFVGNIFELSGRTLGPVDAVYDRAALVALPAEMRDRYTAHLSEITHGAPQLLICYEYDQTLMAGPPFSISRDEVSRHYSDSYALTLLISQDVPGGLKGKCAATEYVWLLKK
ncbi:MAG: thiopurine S-methyltransferase [Cyanobacteria bacterium P01_H01_bin.26]